MKTYTVSAHLGKTTARKSIEADNNMDAMFAAIAHIMDAAYGGDTNNPWAHGQILLSDPDGYTIHSMDAKA